MRGVWRFLLAVSLAMFVAAAPVAAQEMPVVIDLEAFIENEIGGPGVLDNYGDINGDGIFDLPDIPPEGVPGIWDDLVGVSPDEEGNLEFFARTLPEGFDYTESTAVGVGPCGGVLISYDENGLSLDAAIDAGDDNPPIDIYGKNAFTRDNAFRADTRGRLLYWGFTRDVPSLSVTGSGGGENPAFHDHQWNVTFAGVSADNGGDPNPRDKNRNAGVSELGDLIPVKFRAIVKGKAAIIDQYGPERLPEYSAPGSAVVNSIDDIAGSREYCFGEGWIEFVGDGLPLFETPGLIASALALAGFSGLLFNARTALSWRSG